MKIPSASRLCFEDQKKPIYRVGKGRFTVVSMQNAQFILVLFILVLFSIGTTVNLLLPHPVRKMPGPVRDYFRETEEPHKPAGAGGLVRKKSTVETALTLTAQNETRSHPRLLPEGLDSGASHHISTRPPAPATCRDR